MKRIKIKLDEKDFRCLVSGGILTVIDPEAKTEVHIILADIGFHRMDQAISDVESGDLKTYSHLTRSV